MILVINWFLALPIVLKVLSVLFIIDVVCLIYFVLRLRGYIKEARAERKARGIIFKHDNTLYTYHRIKGLNGVDGFKESGNGWLKFKWQKKFYLAMFECDHISHSVFTEITEEQYRG